MYNDCMNFHHKAIRKFSLEGDVLDDASIPRIKEEYKNLIVSQMKIGLCVPRLDINPSFTIKYNDTKNTFTVKITMYGIYVGKENIKWIEAVDEYRPIYTQVSKSAESLMDVG